jgi:hypothetical protein
MNHLNLKSYALCVCLLNVSALLAQKEGTFNLIVITPNAYIKMDTQTLAQMPAERTKNYVLTEGVHHFQIWASGHELTTDSVIIKADSTIRRSFNLKRTAAYVKYRRDLSSFTTDKAFQKISKILIIGGDIGLTWLVAVQGRSASSEKLDVLKASQARYENSLSLNALPSLKSEFEYAKTDYQNSIKYYNTKLAIGIPLTLAAYYATYRLFKKTNKSERVRPEFKDQNPLSHVEYRLNPTYDMAATGSFGLNLNIKF